MDLGQALEGDLRVTLSAIAGDGSLNASETFIIDERGHLMPGG